MTVTVTVTVTVTMTVTVTVTITFAGTYAVSHKQHVTMHTCNMTYIFKSLRLLCML